MLQESILDNDSIPHLKTEDSENHSTHPSLFNRDFHRFGKLSMLQSPTSSSSYVMILGMATSLHGTSETSKIKTPNADNLAKQGTIFTDATLVHPSVRPRYGLLTGRYSWRTRLQKGVVTGFAQV